MYNHPIKRMFEDLMEESYVEIIFKIDGVGPVDNRPSTNKLLSKFQPLAPMVLYL